MRAQLRRPLVINCARRPSLAPALPSVQAGLEPRRPQTSSSSTRIPSPSLKRPRRSWSTPATQRKFLIDLVSKIGLDTKDFTSWYKLDSKQIVAHGGEVLLKLHGASVSKLLLALFPEYPWDISKFTFKPRNYWNDERNQRKALAELQAKLGIAEGDFEAWYKVDTTKVINLGYEVLLRKHGSLGNLLKALFPVHNWDFNRLHNKPRSFWESTENQRKFLLDLEPELGISPQSREGWYKVEYIDVARKGGEPLLKKFGSLPKAVTTLIPEHSWDLSKFRSKAIVLESNAKTRAFLMSLGSKLGIKETDLASWYKVSTKDILQHGGKFLLEIYGNSVSQMLKGIFPEHDWEETKFSHKPQQYWHSLENQRRFFEETALRIGYKKGDLGEFYRLTTREVLKHGGAGLLEVYNKSVSTALESAYADHKWLPWKFQRVNSKNKWHEKDLAQSMVAYVEEKLHIKDLSGWCRVTKQQLRELELDSFFRSEAKLIKLLRLTYPDHAWSSDSMSFSTKKTSK